MKKILLLVPLLVAQIIFAQTGRVGINTDNPSQTLHIVPIIGEPLRVEGLNAAQTADTSLLITDQTTGVVRYIGLSNLSKLISVPADQVWQIILSKPDTLFSNPTFINSFTSAIY